MELRELSRLRQGVEPTEERDLGWMPNSLVPGARLEEVEDCREGARLRLEVGKPT